MAPKTYAQKKANEDAAKYARDSVTRLGMQTQRQTCDPRSWEAVCKTTPASARVDCGSYLRFKDTPQQHSVSAHCRHLPLDPKKPGFDGRAHKDVGRPCGTNSANDKRTKATAKAASKAAAKRISERIARE